MLNFFWDNSLDNTVIKSHVPSFKTGMLMSRFMSLVDISNGFQVQVRWKGLPDIEDTLIPIICIHLDDPEILNDLYKNKLRE